MKAIVISEPGGPEVLTITELPDPVPAPGEILIRVNAFGHPAGRHDREG
jgi:NADPH:quinone reductase